MQSDSDISNTTMISALDRKHKLQSKNMDWIVVPMLMKSLMIRPTPCGV